MPPKPTKTKSWGHPLLALGRQENRAPVALPDPSHAESESTFSLFVISRIVTDLQSSSGVDFSGM
jgi:hypothetical protein